MKEEELWFNNKMDEEETRDSAKRKECVCGNNKQS
jgi:hypothetical protein